jgi:hypothetical protein
MGGVKARGAVFTRQSVVDFILDLVGYTPDRVLHGLRLLEPSFGGGRFVATAARRLVRSWRASEDAGDDSVLDDAVRAVELDQDSFEAFRAELIDLLRAEGLAELSAQRLARAWLVNQDFLDGDVDGPFDVVVGNPPYVRLENVAPGLLAHYRAAYSTMVGRADVYVAFFERSLGLLAPGGRLGFICADAWTKNEYGRQLRQLVTGGFALRAYVDMYGVDAFESEVGAYPSVTVIARGEPGPVRAAQAESADPVYLGGLARELAGPASSTGSAGVVAHPVRGEWTVVVAG